MKLNLTQYNPNAQPNIPGSAGFHFTRHVEYNLKEHLPELRGCNVGLCSKIDDTELPRFMANGWNRIHIKENFNDSEREEAKNKLRSYCGCHIDDAEGFVMYSHYYVMYLPNDVRKAQNDREHAYAKSLVKSSLPNEDGLKSEIEETQVTLEPPEPNEVVKRGPGRPRKE